MLRKRASLRTVCLHSTVCFAASTSSTHSPHRKGRKSLPTASPSKSPRTLLTTIPGTDESDDEPVVVETRKKSGRRVTISTTSPKEIVSPVTRITKKVHASTSKPLHAYSSGEEEEDQQDELHDHVNGTNGSTDDDIGDVTPRKVIVRGRMSTPVVSFSLPEPPSSAGRTPMPSKNIVKPSSGKTVPSRSSSLSSPVSSLNNPSLASYSDSEQENDLFEPASPTFDEVSSSHLRNRRKRFPAIPSSRASTILTQATRDYDERTSIISPESSGGYNWVAMAIVTVSVIFFIGIFSYYLYNTSLLKTSQVMDSKPVQETVDPELELLSKLKVPLCGDVLSNLKSHGVKDMSLCLQSSSDIKPAVHIIRSIVGIFESRLLKHYCSPDSEDASANLPLDPSKMTLKEVRDELVPRLLKDEDKIFSRDSEESDDRSAVLTSINKAINDAITLIQLNSKRFKMTVDEDAVTKSLTLRVDANTFPVTWPVSCKFRFGVISAVWKLAVIAGLAIVSYAIYFFVNVRKQKETREEHVFCELLEKSLELLQSPDEPGSMPVLHIRDTVLSPTEKKDPLMHRVWERVVRHVETSESRVQVSSDEIEGETFKTWKWVCPIVSDASSGNIRTGSIEWQGQASTCPTPRSSLAPRHSLGNNSSSPTNNRENVFVAPTNFLKVRNMFDEQTVLTARNKEDYLWKTRIRNAILFKCSMDAQNGHGICHIFVDERFAKEGLVYIKCRDLIKASEAYASLHGWWCEKKLVSVRFLKPERYFSRFPEARHQTVDLAIESVDGHH